MPVVTGVKFKGNNKLYYFAPGELVLNDGENVIVETARGTEYGTVVAANREVADKSVVQPLKPILRLATDDDRKQLERNEAKKTEAMKAAAEKIQKHKLDMKLVGAEFTFDGQKVIFYFTAEGRVDFRDLVRDLASHFRIRIELRQIGIREECRLLGGIAPCGRACCCSAHLPDFERVSIKMAKNQGLSLNSQKISGLCGRLMCCLSYENAHYCETAKRMPRMNSEVRTPDGAGTVVGNNFLKEIVKVRLPLKDKEGYEIKDYAAKDVKGKSTIADQLAAEADANDDKDIL